MVEKRRARTVCNEVLVMVILRAKFMVWMLFDLLHQCLRRPYC